METKANIVALHMNGLNISEIANETGLSVSIIYFFILILYNYSNSSGVFFLIS